MVISVNGRQPKSQHSILVNSSIDIPPELRIQVSEVKIPPAAPPIQSAYGSKIHPPDLWPRHRQTCKLTT